MTVARSTFALVPDYAQRDSLLARSPHQSAMQHATHHPQPVLYYTLLASILLVFCSTAAPPGTTLLTSGFPFPASVKISKLRPSGRSSPSAMHEFLLLRWRNGCAGFLVRLFAQRRCARPSLASTRSHLQRFRLLPPSPLSLAGVIGAHPTPGGVRLLAAIHAQPTLLGGVRCRRCRRGVLGHTDGEGRGGM